MPATHALEVRGARIAPGGRAIVANLSLDVPEGEIVALIGDAVGAGQALRGLCGLVELAAGGVLAGGRDVARLPPHRRRLPLLAAGAAPVEAGTAAAMIRRVARGADIRPVLAACLTSEEINQPVHALPEAARRRVALARAVASGPACLLVEEPGANLPAEAAEDVFAAYRRVRAGGIAMLVATVRPETAFALAERGVALAGGVTRQAGWLRDLHDSPADEAVAALLGPVNRLPGRVVGEEDDIVTVRLTCGPLVEARREDVALGSDCVVCVRPGRVAMANAMAEDMGTGAMSARVRDIRFAGDTVRLGLEIGATRQGPATLLTVSRPAILPLRVRVGETVAVAWQPYHAAAFRRGAADDVSR